ncbi:MAG: Crp/Fnr family transcriptional regulator [Dissulfuribacterales bacterium]
MLQKIAAVAQLRRYQRGQRIFDEGDAGNGFYMVSKGRVKIFKLSPEGKEQILHVFGHGEPFGEVAVFEGRNFPASAEAMEAMEAIFIARSDFIELIQKNPALTLKMLSMLSMRLRFFAHLIEDLSLKDVPSRLARYLLLTAEKQKNNKTIQLDITRGQLASLLGTIPETLSRIFSRLQTNGILSTNGNAVTIQDFHILEAIAEGSTKL